jgi:hypothetical protein
MRWKSLTATNCTHRDRRRHAHLEAGSHPWPPQTDLLLPHRRCRPPVTSSGLAQRRAACRRGDRLDEIIEWYVELVRLTDSAGAGLNLAVTVGEADGPRAGLAALPRPAPPPPPRRTCTIVTVTH